ncbi:hypothetical protein JQ634_28410 [Bradyrhizobium sp. AUGA SZCCT0240]|uniref:hypothetical protein n=1 Tax=unclassified Bradyrhizobium TaxID=2631580 RepID=UPI001BAE1C12|nr:MULTISPECIES: hypothetical protein [unclassified Bradyrhizobium]MBR1198979.1 hypothetical protein [Bradyrhizobium sp. AUGA SZCCT0158]MBR1239608.1 hypothetical protein [Bradyrhizobium sp. AUGA SZCCT0274]MBR1257599.1 hypothetical protein [Bradyrhizobium sp. AUGA SZCCT0240]
MAKALEAEIPNGTNAAPVIRIPKDSLVAWKTELSEWAASEVFRTRIDQIARSIPRGTFFRQGGLAFLRDAWIASRVACALQSDMVRLVTSPRPDFEIQVDGQTLQFEATEADMEGRRRGDEPDDPHPRMDPVENWRRRFEAIPAALDRVVSRKLKKEYPPGVSLAIYVNLGCYGAFIEEGLPILRDHTAAARAKFKSVFVLWEGYLYKLWEEGNPRFEKWQYVDPDDF